VAQQRSAIRRPLPSPGFPTGRFPCFAGTMRRSDSLRPFLRTSFSLAWRYHAGASVLRFARPDAGRRPGTLGVRPSLIGRTKPGGDDQGLPRSWGTRCALAWFSDPGEPNTPRHDGVLDMAPAKQKAKATATNTISGLNGRLRHSLSTPRRLSRLRTTQDSLRPAG
jgi:hypothetical protein